MEDQQKQKEVQELINDLENVFNIQTEVEKELRIEYGRCGWLCKKIFNNSEAKSLVTKRVLQKLNLNNKM